MAQKRKTDQSQKIPAKIAGAALALAAKSDWGALTLPAIAKKAKLPLKTVEASFADIWEILIWVLKKLERDTNAAVKKSLGSSWRDNLFDLLMTRAELARENRGAFKSLPKALAKHPQGVALLARPFYEALGGMLLLSGVKKSACTPLLTLALAALYLSVAQTWMKDDTSDLSKTMAALDKRLGWLERIYQPLLSPLPLGEG